MHILFKYLLVTVALSSILFSNSNSPSLEKVSLQLQWKHQFEFAGFYIAKEKGYYSNVGLDVEIKEFNHSIDIVDDVYDGKSTYGVNYPSLMLKKIAGKDIVLLSAILQSSPHVLVSLKSSGIKSIKDFKNKRIMVVTGETKSASLTSMLKAEGITSGDMIEIAPSFDVEDLLSDKTDVLSAFSSNELYGLDKRGVEYDIWDPKDYGFDFYDVILFTSNEEVKKNPIKVKAFRDASLEGWRYAFEHIEETVDLILKKYNTQNKTKDALLYEAKVLKELAYANDSKLGSLDKNKIQRIYDIYKIMGLAQNPIDMDSFIFSLPEKADFLTEKEREYLKNKKVITMCIDPDWMPFERFQEGKHIGISADYFKLFESVLEIPVNVVQTQTWLESLEKAQKRECDILSLVMPTPQREKYLKFTEPYLEIPLVLATKLEVPFVNDIGSLKTQKIGIPKGYAFGELLKVKYPMLNIVDVESTEDGLEKVNNGDLFGYIGTLASVGYMFQTSFTGELKIAGKFDRNWELGVGVRDDDKVLFSIFNKIIKNIDSEKRQRILNEWIAVKYEKGTDYSLVWKLLVVVFFVILIGIYRNNILKKSNISLQMARKRAEEKALEAHQQKENFRYILDTTMEAIGIYEDNICVELNDSAVSMYGYDNKEQILGRNALEFVAPSFKALVIKNIGDRYTQAYEINALKADGSEFPVLIKGKSYEIGGKTQRLVSVLDLTQFKATEKELIKAKEIAEDATKIKADFLSNMSHEIRTPMNGIVGMLHILGKTSLDDKQLEYVQKVKTASNNLLYMINDLLDFSKLEAGKLEVHRVDFDMNRVLQNVEDLLEIKALEKRLRLDIKFLESDSVFYGDSARLSQVLINLTNNAIKFTHEGEVKITLKFIHERVVRFSIKDTGIGISQEQQEELFQSFKQADSTITREYGGSGLGLSISKELIELMDGEIWLESELGQGSEFIFELSLPKGDSTKIDTVALHAKENEKHDKDKKKDISQEKRDELFSELRKAIETSRPKSCDPIIEEMNKYNFSDKDDKIFKGVLLLLKKYKFKEILVILDGK